jgi:uncharacterized membrane protein YjjP (DUF1212 family)
MAGSTTNASSMCESSDSVNIPISPHAPMVITPPVFYSRILLDSDESAPELQSSWHGALYRHLEKIVTWLCPLSSIHNPRGKSAAAHAEDHSRASSTTDTKMDEIHSDVGENSATESKSVHEIEKINQGGVPTPPALWTEPGLSAWLGHVRSRLRLRSVSPAPVNVNASPLRMAASRKFLEVFGRGLISCGLPVHVAEFYLHLAADRFGQHVAIVSLQTTLFMTFGEDPICHLLVAESPTTSLSKMVEMCHVAENIVQGRVNLTDATAAVQHVLCRPQLWSHSWRVVCLILVSAAYTPLFNGGWIEMIIASFSGLLIAGVESWKNTNPSIVRGQDLLAGLFCSITAVLMNEYLVTVNVLAACLSGVVWMLPGLRVSMAVINISSGHAITGSAQLLSGLLTAINIGIGITCGLQLQAQLSSNPIITNSSSVFPAWSVHLFVIVSVFPSIVLMDALVSHIPTLMIGMVTAYEVSTALTPRIGAGFGSFIAAAVISCMSNLYERWTPHPSVELFLFSALVILPGAIGVEGVLASDSLTALNFLLEMIEIVIAIVAGWFGGNVIIPALRVM